MRLLSGRPRSSPSPSLSPSQSCPVVVVVGSSAASRTLTTPAFPAARTVPLARWRLPATGRNRGGRCPTPRASAQKTCPRWAGFCSVAHPGAVSSLPAVRPPCVWLEGPPLLPGSAPHSGDVSSLRASERHLADQRRHARPAFGLACSTGPMVEVPHLSCSACRAGRWREKILGRWRSRRAEMCPAEAVLPVPLFESPCVDLGETDVASQGWPKPGGGMGHGQGIAVEQ